MAGKRETEMHGAVGDGYPGRGMQKLELAGGFELFVLFRSGRLRRAELVPGGERVAVGGIDAEMLEQCAG